MIAAGVKSAMATWEVQEHTAALTTSRHELARFDTAHLVIRGGRSGMARCMCNLQIPGPSNPHPFQQSSLGMLGDKLKF